MRPSHMLRLGLLVGWVSIPACSESGTGLKPSPTAHPTGEIQRIIKKTQVLRFEGYVYELPERFKPTESGIATMPGVKQAEFSSPAKNGDTNKPQETLVITYIADELGADVRKENPRQRLVNFSAGFSDRRGYKVQQRGNIRLQRIGDQDLNVMPIVLSDSAGTEILSLAACISGKGHFIFMMYLGFSGDHVENAEEVEACLGTFEFESK